MVRFLNVQLLYHLLGTLTILTSVANHEPVIFHYSTENNTQLSFVEFVVQCCLDGDLKTGEYLVLDNAPVHQGKIHVLQTVLEFFGVNLVFLPAYSPELNPCELVFGLIKHFI